MRGCQSHSPSGVGQQNCFLDKMVFEPARKLEGGGGYCLILQRMTIQEADICTFA
jgi:hypothetical protein